MRRVAFAVSLFAVIHAAACLWLIPWSNTAFQLWFDTGSPMSKAGSIGNLVALALSFPFALWAMMIHPARVSTPWLVASVIVNSSLWAACLYVMLAWLRQRRHQARG